jgi:hypothetical protein
MFAIFGRRLAITPDSSAGRARSAGTSGKVRGCAANLPSVLAFAVRLSSYRLGNAKETTLVRSFSSSLTDW